MKWIITFVCTVLLFATAAVASPIDIDSARIRTTAVVDYDLNAIDETITEAPWSGSQHAVSPARDHTGEVSTSTTHYDLTGVTLTLDMAEHKTAIGGATAATWSEIFFTASQDEQYSIDGIYEMAGQSGVRLWASLFDTTSGTTLYDSNQESKGATDATFTLGEFDGNFQNWLVGSSTGELIAGHTYEFEVYAHVYKPGTGGTSPESTASGWVTMIVPEPSTAMLLGFGLLGIAARSRHTATRFP